MKDENVILFDEFSKVKLLEVMDKAIDSKNFIVENSNPSQRVLTEEGEEVKLDEFAGVRKGSEIFIKSDINSVLELADYIDKNDNTRSN